MLPRIPSAIYIDTLQRLLQKCHKNEISPGITSEYSFLGFLQKLFQDFYFRDSYRYLIFGYSFTDYRKTFFQGFFQRFNQSFFQSFIKGFPLTPKGTDPFAQTNVRKGVSFKHLGGIPGRILKVNLWMIFRRILKGVIGQILRYSEKF